MEIKSILGEKVLIEWRKMQSLQPDNLKLPYNIAYLKQSLIENNFAMPFFGWQNGEEVYVIDGHQRLQVLMELEGEGVKIPELLDCQLIKAKDRKEAVKILLKVYNQRSNPIDLEVLTEWVNIEQVEVEVQSLNVVDINDIEEEAQEILEAEEDDFDSTPPETPETVLGDIYEIGEHRLLCGDSTDSDQVAKLMNGQKADMVFTDPPYGVSYEGGHNKKKRTGIQNDTLQGQELTDLFYEALVNGELFSHEHSAFYIWYANGKAVETFASFSKLSLKVRAVICWYKVKSGLGAFMSQYIPNYEPCIYAYKEGYIPQWFGPSDEKTVWELKKESKNEFHPTQKPIELPERAIKNSSKENDIVLDLFGGSGSTMVAAQQLKRKARLMEFDPKYCDVIIKRMIKLDSNLKIKRNGVDETKKWLDKIN